MARLEAFVSKDSRYFELRIIANVEMEAEAIFAIMAHAVDTYRDNPERFFRDWARAIPDKSTLP